MQNNHEIVEMYIYDWSIDSMNSFESDDGEYEKKRHTDQGFSDFLKFLLSEWWLIAVKHAYNAVPGTIRNLRQVYNCNYGKSQGMKITSLQASIHYLLVRYNRVSLCIIS